MPSKTSTIDLNNRFWHSVKSQHDFSPSARRLVAAKARYQIVARRTGVLWPIIAVIHERESSQSWLRSLAQGDPWDRVSVHVPAGRGPFASWEDAAVDALVNCAPYAARWRDWSIGGALTLLEHYNGLGYARRGVPSPYVWAGTDQYRAGKYVRDGVYDPQAVDRQPGCAGLLKAMMEIDATISFAAGPVESGPPPVTGPPASPSASIRHPAEGSIGALFAALLRRVLGQR
jgi:lysozyme family protein